MSKENEMIVWLGMREAATQLIMKTAKQIQLDDCLLVRKKAKGKYVIEKIHGSIKIIPLNKNLIAVEEK